MFKSITTLILLITLGFAAQPVTAQLEEAQKRNPVFAGLSVSEAFVEAFATGDWNTLHATLSASDRLERSPQDIQAALTPALRALGPMRFFLLSKVGASNNGCQQRQFAVSGQFGVGRIEIRACPEGDGIVITDFGVVPDVKVAAHSIFPEVLAKNLGFGFLYVDCDVDDALPINENFECEAISSEGLSLKFVLKRTGANSVSPVSYEQISSVKPQADQRQLQLAAQLVLALYSNEDFDSVYSEASLPFRSLIDKQNYTSQLRAIFAQLGKVESSEWLHLHEDPANGLPLVELNATFASGQQIKVAVRLMPGRNRWRMDGLYFDYERGTELDRQVTKTRLDAQAVRRTGDDSATINCPIAELVKREKPVNCTGRAYGRDVTFLVRPLTAEGSQWFEDPLETAVLDFQTILRHRLETVESQLGWTVDGLQCDNPNPEPLNAVRCVTQSPDGPRVLTVINLGDSIRVLDVRRGE